MTTIRVLFVLFNSDAESRFSLVLYKFPLVELDMRERGKTLKAAGIEPSETLTLEQCHQTSQVTRGIPEPEVPFIILREVPDDNSCLFNAIGYVLEDKDMSTAQYLRDSNPSRLYIYLFLSGRRVHFGSSISIHEGGSW